ncbi:MurR/RpiR family transcriptional regulator [Salirhabdus sp. Marseille-P4669]|uniref:MurR/RpiR family transcriptional regulator n=1 Tax=Salirhabdus sp. Marseille-P4669 TaxID=2042310 RepID=UPI000C79FCC8|nr:MurR/RpiR family transcriptional regulator [Salirhabdus sp. Marseille-P4669]
MENENQNTSLIGGLVRIDEVFDRLPPSEKKVALYILKHPHEAIYSTASELGRLSGTSSAAVIRLCKSLGLKGFPELKFRISGDLQKPADLPYRDIQPGETQYSIVDKLTSNSITAIRETVKLVNYTTLNKAVDALIHAPKIHFFGVGASGIIAQDAQQKFLRMNKATSAFTDVHNAAMYIANGEKEDVVFGISFSGETKETVKMLELARKKGVKTISLTRYGTSSVTEQADINLFTSASREIPAPFRNGATSSRLAQLHMIDILFVSVVTARYEEAVGYQEEIRRAVEFMKG